MISEHNFVTKEISDLLPLKDILEFVLNDVNTRRKLYPFHHLKLRSGCLHFLTKIEKHFICRVHS